MTNNIKKYDDEKAVEIIPSQDMAQVDISEALRYQASRLRKKSKTTDCIREVLDLAKANSLIGKEARDRAEADKLSGMTHEQLLAVAKLVLTKLPLDEKKALIESLVEDVNNGY